MPKANESHITPDALPATSNVIPFPVKPPKPDRLSEASNGDFVAVLEELTALALARRASRDRKLLRLVSGETQP